MVHQNIGKLYKCMKGIKLPKNTSTISREGNLASQGLYTSARATAKTLVDTGHVTTQILGGI
jgi:hypothetical protein